MLIKHMLTGITCTVLLTGCSVQSLATKQSTLAQQEATGITATRLTNQRQWRLKTLPSVSDLSGLDSASIPFLSLSQDSINGFSGCNRFFGQPTTLVQASSGARYALTIGDLAMTRMRCDPINTQLEQTFIAMLNSADHLTVQWPFLNIYQNDRLVAKFVATDWD